MQTDSKEGDQPAQKAGGAGGSEWAWLAECQAVAGVGSWEINLGTGELRWTAETYRLFEVDPESFQPNIESVLQFYTPASREMVREKLRRAREYGESYDVVVEVLTARGRRIWLRSQSRVQFAEGRPVRVYGVIQDITEYKRAEDELRENQRVFSTLLANLPGMAYRCRNDADWTMEFVSDGCHDLTGYTPVELVGNRTISYELVTHPEDRKPVRDVIDAGLASHQPYEVTYRIVTAYGIEKWVWERGEGIYNASGSLLFLEGFITDVTERRRAQEKVREQAALLDKAQDAIVVTDLEGRVHYWNSSAERVFGWNASGVNGRMMDELFVRDRDRFLEARRQGLERGDWAGELRATTRSGGEVIVESRWTLVRDDQGKPHAILSINTDITERKRLESQFLRAQRLESIGTLAGGVAHDLNNVLSPILMALDLMRLRNREPQTASLIDTARSSAERGAEMVKQILSFARGVDGRRIPVQPRELIRDLQRIISETFPKSIRIQARPAKQVAAVIGDPTQLHQVLLNLCVNARDAMPDGGTLTVTADNIDIDEQYCAMNPQARPGTYLLLQVTDTGTGIPEAIRERIFDPFFTTKEMGKGTGLGLSTVLAIVKSHGGFLDLYTEPGRGTTFKVYLPARHSREGGHDSRVGESVRHGHGEWVLVVDDEEAIRSITRQSLEAFGYRVILAADGSEAMELYKPRAASIALVITDMMMPVMDGGALMLALTRINPSVRLLATSGLAAPSTGGRWTGAGPHHFLPKPYTAEALLQAVTLVLGH